MLLPLVPLRDCLCATVVLLGGGRSFVGGVAWWILPHWVVGGFFRVFSLWLCILCCMRAREFRV